MAGYFISINDRKSLSELAYEALFKGIVSGDIRPGERLNELKIAAQMGVSRAPVREAIQRLRQAGLVVLAPGKQPTVIQLSLKELREVFLVRVALEISALESLSPTALIALALRLAKVLDEVRYHAMTGNQSKALDAELRFHELIVEAANNDLLLNMYSSIVARLRTVLAFSSLEYVDLRDSADEHNAIVSAVQFGDLDSAKQLLKDHLWAALPYLESHPAIATEISLSRAAS